MIGSNKRAIPSYGYISVEGRVVDRIGMCNSEVVSQKGGICWTSTMGQHEESPYGMGQYIWIWSVGNGGRHFSRYIKNSTDTECPNQGPWFEKFM